MTFAQAYSAYLNDVIWLIVIAFFFARGFVKTGLGDRVATLFVKYLVRALPSAGVSPLFEKQTH
jgi:DASS family divalent anion:Na+ symporter